MPKWRVMAMLTEVPLHTKLHLTIALCLLSLFYAPQSKAGSDPVAVKVLGVDDVSVGLKGVSFVLLLEAQRTRGLAIHLKSAEARVQVARVELDPIHLKLEGTRLKKGKPIQIRVPCSLDAISAIGAVGQAAAKGKVNIKAEGTVSGRVFIFPFTRPFSVKPAPLSLR
jgi:hypothetical protein